MSKKKKINVKHHERALLTDTLPFEIPIFFTNENLAILAHACRTKGASHQLHEKLLISESDRPLSTKPLSYEIARISARPRALSLPHPKSQHLMACFYESHENFILNSCNRTSYSLRHPSRVATHYVESRYAKASSTKIDNDADEDPVGFRDQSRWPSTYFSYRDYSLIYKFFESDEFLSLETRFPLMMNLDISRCFESIYTHSIEWSMRGKEFSKDHLPNPKKEKTTFESTFDAVIRSANENETHGILVGPESSRIFAEVILQSIDRPVARELNEKHLDVVVKRYVDDYYIFGNTVESLEKVKEVIRRQLLLVNLHLNDQKASLTKRPFSSRTGAARLRVTHTIDNFISKSLQAANDPVDHSTSRKIDALRIKLGGF